MRRSDLRIGIDVGGTNTDAVVLDRDDSVLAWAKTPTTPDVTGGIRARARCASSPTSPSTALASPT